MRTRYSTLLALGLALGIAGCSNATPSKTASAASSAPTPPQATVDSVETLSMEKVPEGLTQTLQANLQKAGIQAKISTIRGTELPGIFWVTFDEFPSVYASVDGKHLFQGELVRLGAAKPVNVNDELISVDAKKALNAIPAKEEIIFKAAGTPKAAVYVFTDVDCGYCRKLHNEVGQITAKGIEVRYLAWPRSPQSVPDMESVWCSEDRQSALTTAKQGLPVKAAKCNNPVMQHRNIGIRLGVQGTPAIYTTEGKYLGGYIPAEELAKRLGL